ncbi:hypothetical protein ACWD4P_27225 [Kitasatospora sp. NPDC002543]
MTGTDGRERTEPGGTGRRTRRDRDSDRDGVRLPAPEPRLHRVLLGLRGRAWDMVRGVRPRTVLGLALLSLVLLSLALLAAGLGASAAPSRWVLAGGWALALAAALAVLRACADGRRGEER